VAFTADTSPMKKEVKVAFGVSIPQKNKGQGTCLKLPATVKTSSKNSSLITFGLIPRPNY